jgi:hypothetical protein
MTGNFCPLKITSGGGQGPCNNGGSAKTMAPVIEEEHKWFVKLLQLVFAKEVQHSVTGTVLS